jgi:hypothetical protein
MPTLELTTVASCTVRCTYCPQDALKAAYRPNSPHRLALSDLRIVLDKLPPHVRVDFSGFVEPWLNPDCTEMLREVLARGFSVGVYTTLQGMKDPDEVVGLLTRHAAQIEVVCLHLPDRSGNMTGHKDDGEWRAALARFLAFRDREILPRFELMTMERDGLVAATIPVGRLTQFVGVDRAGSLDREAVGSQPLEKLVEHLDPVGCSFTPFYDQNVLLPNGDVVLCCQDYGLRHKLGNLLLRDTWEGLDRGKMLDANLRPNTRTICKECTRAVRYKAPPHARQMWQEVK